MNKLVKVWILEGNWGFLSNIEQLGGIIMKNEMEKLNPFFSIWFSTRKTIRYVLDYKDLKYSIMIAAVAGIPNAIGAIGEWEKNFDLPLWLILVGVILTWSHIWSSRTNDWSRYLYFSW